MAGSGWCHHPSRRITTDVMIMVRRNELACRNSWAEDLWAPATAGAAPNGSGPRPLDDPLPTGPERPATEDEIAAVLNSQAGMPELEIPDPIREDVVVGEGPSMTAATRHRATAPAPRLAPDRESEFEADDRATILAQDTRAAIIKARERHKARTVPRGRPMELPLSDMPEGGTAPEPIATPSEVSAVDPGHRSDVAHRSPPPSSDAISRAAEAPVADPLAAAGAIDQATAGPPPEVRRQPDLPVAADRFDSVPARRPDVDLPRPSVPPRAPLAAGLDDDFDQDLFPTGRRAVPPPADRRDRRPDVARPAAAAERRPLDNGRAAVERRDRPGREIAPRRAPNGAALPGDARSRAAGDAGRPSSALYDRPPGGDRGQRDSATLAPRPAASATHSHIDPDCPPAQPVYRAERRRERAERLPDDAMIPPPTRAMEEGGDPLDAGAIEPVGSTDGDAVPPIAVAGRDEIDDSMLDMTVQIAPLVPRMCRTCRDFKPSDDSERGWCNNRWAFTHRRMVDAVDPEPPCQTTLGCWWLPSDRVWAESADVSNHGLPTPLLELFMPHLFEPKERPTVPPRRRQS